MEQRGKVLREMVMILYGLGVKKKGPQDDFLRPLVMCFCFLVSSDYPRCMRRIPYDKPHHHQRREDVQEVSWKRCAVMKMGIL